MHATPQITHGESPERLKKLWRLNKLLPHKQTASSLSPPLKDSQGEWCRTAAEKANAFAKCWEVKAQLLPETVELPFFHTTPCLASWFPIRPRAIRRLLRKLRPDQATGPDGINALFLKKLAPLLSTPLAHLTRRFFHGGIWPDRWRKHHVAPIYKRGSVYQPGQYRGVHLTTALSKAVERAIGQQLIPFLTTRAYGKSSGAFANNVVRGTWSPSWWPSGRS